jgi:ParB family chromosome partitioning protein
MGNPKAFYGGRWERWYDRRPIFAYDIVSRYPAILPQKQKGTHMSNVQTRIEMIPLTAIVDPEWNSRVEKTGAEAKAEAKAIERMAAQFADPRVGQEQAIVVEELGQGKYMRVAGYRRVKAAKLAGWTEIRAEIRTPSDPIARARLNAIENMERENLTTYEVARAADHFRNFGLKNEEIGPMLHLSPSAVSNWANIYKGVPAAVAKDWQNGAPAATQDNLSDVARKHKDDESKLQAWDEMQQKAASEDRKPGKRGKGKRKGGGSSPQYSVSQVRITLLIDRLSRKAGSPTLSDETRKWGKSVVDFIIQQRDAIGGVVDLKAEEADAKAAKEQEKAAAKAEKDAAKAATKAEKNGAAAQA